MCIDDWYHCGGGYVAPPCPSGIKNGDPCSAGTWPWTWIVLAVVGCGGRIAIEPGDAEATADDDASTSMDASVCSPTTGDTPWLGPPVLDASGVCTADPPGTGYWQCPMTQGHLGNCPMPARQQDPCNGIVTGCVDCEPDGAATYWACQYGVLVEFYRGFTCNQ